MIQKNLNLFDPSNMSAFGTLEVGELTPIIQLDWVYNYINKSQTGASTITNSAVVDANGGRLRLQSGTNSAGSAIFNSRRIARYRAGQGSVARFTAAFTTGVAGNTQIVGVGTSVDGYFFGYNGTEFGIPLAQAVLGQRAGSVVPYRMGDIREVKILSVTAGLRARQAHAAASRQAVIQKAISQSDLADAVRFALTVDQKWGETDPEGIVSRWDDRRT